MSDGHYITRIDDEEYISDTELEESFLSDKFNLSSNDVFVISDYNKGTIKNSKKLIDKLQAKVLIDPKLSLDHYKGAYLIKPNKKEFESFVGKCETPKKLIAQAQLLRDHLNLTYLVVTLGSEGVLLIGDAVEHYPAEVQEGNPPGSGKINGFWKRFPNPTAKKNNHILQRCKRRLS